MTAAHRRWRLASLADRHRIRPDRRSRDARQTFHWTSAGLSIGSTIYAVEAPRRILWGGTAHGITAIHDWRFEADGDGTLVRNEESWSGDPVDADTENSRKLLGQSLDAWLEHLRRAAEDPA